MTSVLSDGDQSYVWTIEAGKAKKVNVTLGNADAENQEILSGLNKDVSSHHQPFWRFGRWERGRKI